MPSVLFINRVYPPASGATGQLLAELASELEREGWSVSVASTKGQARCLSYFKRALGYLCVYPRLFLRALLMPRTDVVVTMTDPPLQIVLGPIVSWLKGARHIHWAQDLYPEVAEELGVLKKNGFFARLLRRISTAAMRQADCTIAIGECMKQRLTKRGLAPERIKVIPNWGCCGPTATADAVCEFRQQHALGDRFVVMYSGNIGLAHSFDAILDAACRLQYKSANVVFVFVGDGPRIQEVRNTVATSELKNVVFLPVQPKETLEISLAAADLHLASLRDELCGLIVPSKVYGALATARPCFFIGPPFSEAAQLLVRRKLGSVFGTSDGVALAETIARWVADPALVEQAKTRLRPMAAQFRIAPAVIAFMEVLGEGKAGQASSLSRSYEEVMRNRDRQDACSTLR